MTVIHWDASARPFTGLSSAVLALPAQSWERLGATFEQSDDPNFPFRVATGTVDTLVDRGQAFALVDEGDVTTLLVPGDEDRRSLVASGVLFALSEAGAVQLERDLLQSGIGDFIATARGRQIAPSASDSVREEAVVGPAPDEPPSAGEGRGLGSASLSDWLVSLGGGDGKLVARVPTERPRFVAYGSAALISGLMTGSALAIFVADFVDVALGLAVALGVLAGCASASLDRLLLSLVRQSSSWQTALAALPRLVVAFLFALLVGQVVSLELFRADILAELGRRSNAPSPSLAESLEALDDLSQREPGVQFTRWLITVLVASIQTMPVLLKVLELFGRTTPYEHVQRIVEQHSLTLAMEDARLREVKRRTQLRRAEEAEDQTTLPKPSTAQERSASENRPEEG